MKSLFRHALPRACLLARLNPVNLFFIALLAASSLAGCHAERPANFQHSRLSLIPQPAQVDMQPGVFHLRQGSALIVDSQNAEAVGIARRFADLLAQTRGIHLDVLPFGEAGDARGAIVFSLDARDTLSPEGEGYRLSVNNERIRVSARESRGLFYGGVTLWQLLTQDVAHTTLIDVPNLLITDAPHFRWRGAMLDSARHFQSPDFIRHFIDQLALAKLNIFHWHLTDDQGWRIEIKKYPRLTEIGAWRKPAGAAGTDANGKPVRYGGYYTQDEIRDIVLYARERNVTIVPEIDMPGHMQAAIAAYPELGSAGDTPVVSPDWGVHSYILNVDEATFTFVENVLDEVMALFPAGYIHVGGDEAVKDQWKASSQVQARMHALGMANEDALQGWFIARLQKYLAAHGRKLIGWDEILEGGVPPAATVMSWRGAKGGIDAAQQGHDVVMAPSPDLYLDHLQSDAADEPSGRPDLRTLADIYAFEPTPAGMGADAAVRVLGAQANLWTEHMRTPALVEHAAFPRLAALAEVLWSPPSTRDWNSFVLRLAPQMDRYAAAGVAVANSAFEVRFASEYDAASRRVKVTLSNQVAQPIHYTDDGSLPVSTSRLYRAPLIQPIPSTLRAATFVDGRIVGGVETSELTRADILRRSSDALKPCSGKLPLRLEDDGPAVGARTFFTVDLFDPCWIYTNAPLDGIVAIEVGVGHLPYNFQLWKDAANVVPRPAPQSPDGELLVKIDSCSGATLATIPLQPARQLSGVTTLRAALPTTDGKHDLCFVFTGRGSDPLWAIDRVQLIPGTSAEHVQ
ncbi:MAG: family 20 glycosylhydrolase [Dokdonella sp.]